MVCVRDCMEHLKMSIGSPVMDATTDFMMIVCMLPKKLKRMSFSVESVSISGIHYSQFVCSHVFVTFLSSFYEHFEEFYNDYMYVHVHYA